MCSSFTEFWECALMLTRAWQLSSCSVWLSSSFLRLISWESLSTSICSSWACTRSTSFCSWTCEACWLCTSATQDSNITHQTSAIFRHELQRKAITEPGLSLEISFHIWTTKHEIPPSSTFPLQHRKLRCVQVRGGTAGRGRTYKINWPSSLKALLTYSLVSSMRMALIFIIRYLYALYLYFLVSHLKRVKNPPSTWPFARSDSSRGYPVFSHELTLTLFRVFTRGLARETLENVRSLSLGHLRSHIQPLQRMSGDSLEFSAGLKAAYKRAKIQRQCSELKCILI